MIKSTSICLVDGRCPQIVLGDHAIPDSLEATPNNIINIHCEEGFQLETNDVHTMVCHDLQWNNTSYECEGISIPIGET